jgi:hypothetical protein
MSAALGSGGSVRWWNLRIEAARLTIMEQRRHRIDRLKSAGLADCDDDGQARQ